MISVIIAHYNQNEMLAGCLRSLAGHEVPGHAVEVIVVDNGSRIDPAPVVARFPGVQLLHERAPGPGPARNLGAGAARGEIFAFIDADMQAGPGWLAAIARAFADPATQIAGGDVRILPRDPALPTAIEAYEAEYAFRMQHYIRDQGFTGGGNLAVRRDVLEHVGPFAGIDEAEDRDWGQRASRMGYRIRWIPDMLAFHPARESFAELVRKWERQIAHDFARVRSPRHRAAWALRCVAVAMSPLASLPRIARSRRVVGGIEGKVRAFAVLCRIRLYRARIMADLAWRGDRLALAGRWRDPV